MVAIITEEQKDLLIGKEFRLDSYFNPIQDINNNWVISQQEINQNENEQLIWLHDLKLTNYKPKEILK
jgi:hypothetical protein